MKQPIVGATRMQRRGAAPKFLQMNISARNLIIFGAVIAMAFALMFANRVSGETKQREAETAAVIPDDVRQTGSTVEAGATKMQKLPIDEATIRAEDQTNTDWVKKQAEDAVRGAKAGAAQAASEIAASISERAKQAAHDLKEKASGIAWTKDKAEGVEEVVAESAEWTKEKADAVKDAAVDAKEAAGDDPETSAKGMRGRQMPEQPIEGLTEPEEVKLLRGPYTFGEKVADTITEKAEEVAEAVEESVASGMAKASHAVLKGAQKIVEGVIRTAPEAEHTCFHPGCKKSFVGKVVDLSKRITRHMEGKVDEKEVEAEAAQEEQQNQQAQNTAQNQGQDEMKARSSGLNL